MPASLPFSEIEDFILQDIIQDNPHSLAIRAYQPSLKRFVFIKLLKPHIQNHSQWVQRFIREAQVCAQLKHPNIVDVYAVGEKDGYTYMALEFVEGLSVKDLLEKEGPLPVAESIEIFRQAILALAFVHQHGIVHRDIKPGNILLDIYGQVRITDFGLAHLGEDDSLTQHGHILGTPAYMAPEQIIGEKVGAATDCFGLGATLYEMLTGVKAFGGETYSACIQKILNEDPPAPAKLNKAVPPDLEQLIFQCLAKDPEKRPAEAEHILRGINTLLSPEEQAVLQRKIAGRVRKHYSQGRPPASQEAVIGKTKQPPGKQKGKNNFSRSSYRMLLIGVALLLFLLIVAYMVFSSGMALMVAENLRDRTEINPGPPPAEHREMTATSDSVAASGAQQILSPENQENRTSPQQGKIVSGMERSVEPAQTGSPDVSVASEHFELTASAEKEKTALPATVNLTVEPWAQVQIDQTRPDTVISQKQIKLPAGDHRLVLSHPGFLPKILELTLLPGEQRSINYSFYRDVGVVLVEARPWAEVYVDGQFVDNTPLSRPIFLSPGPHLLELKHPYFETVRKYLEVTAGDTIKIQQTMEKQ